jgi:hypothetical protein
VGLVVPGPPPGAVPVVAGPDTDPVTLARLLVADAGRCGWPGPFAPTVVITAPEVLVALTAATPGPLQVMDEGDVADLRRGAVVRSDPDVRLRLVPVAALVPEDPLACPWSPGTDPQAEGLTVAAVPVAAVDDAARAVRAVHAAVRLGTGPGPVLAVHGSAWRHATVAAAAAAGFGRVVVDGPTTPTDPLVAAPLRPAEARRWTRVDGWASPWTGSGGAPGPQPPYPHPSNRGPG